MILTLKIIRPNENKNLSLAFFLLATVAGAQTLRGKVTDDQKEPSWELPS